MFVSYTLEIEKSVKEKIQAIADAEQRSLASQIRIALDKYLESVSGKTE